MAQPYIAVVGSGGADADTAAARRVGQLLAEAGAILVCGGLGGVMQAAAEGSIEAGGLTVGILPGSDRSAGNPHLTVAIPTGLGELRNGLVVRAADVVIALDGGAGTLSEIALAVKTGVPVVALDDRGLPEVHRAEGPEGLVAAAIELASRNR